MFSQPKKKPTNVFNPWIGKFPPEKAAVLQSILTKNTWCRHNKDLVEAGLITQEQLSNLLHSHAKCLLSDNGIKALAYNYLNVDEIIAIQESLPFDRLERLLSKNGLIALAQNLITLAEAAMMPWPIHLTVLFDDKSNGCLALQNKYINLNQVKAFEGHSDLWRLECLLSPQGIMLLERQGITLADTHQFKERIALEDEILDRLVSRQVNVCEDQVTLPVRPARG